MKFIKNLSKTYLIFLIIMSISILLYTLILYLSAPKINEFTLSIISLFVMIFLFFILGLITGAINKEKGLINGAVSALILFTFIIIFKLITKSFDYSLLIKALCTIFASAFGGYLGALKK